MKKKVLFIGIGFYDYDKIIIQQFEQLGYQVDYFCEIPQGLKFRYYQRRANKQQTQRIIDQVSLNIARSSGFNYHIVFVIKGEHLTIEGIELLKKKNPDAKWILYLWDSIDRIPGSARIFPYFHDIFSFDRVNCLENPNLKFNPLFYRQEYYHPYTQNTPPFDLYFLGWYHSDRLKLITEIISFCNQNNLKYNVMLYAGLYSYLRQVIKGGELKQNKELLIYKPIPSTKNIQNILNAQCTLDIAHPLQTGLTMRTIELLGAGRKIITTNADIINYDFYNPENVAIIDRGNLNLEVDFFNTPYVKVDQDIVQKYSLSSWLSRMLS